MRYKVEESKEPGWWVITDLLNGIVVRWHDHHFNETQIVTFLDDDKDVIKRLGSDGISRVMTEIGDWLFSHHYSKVFETPVFELQLSEDDKELRLIRRKHPAFTVLIESDCDPHKVGSALKKAGEFLIKYKRRYEN